jgi:DNA-binding NarL/FixJ family response regulator
MTPSLAHTTPIEVHEPQGQLLFLNRAGHARAQGGTVAIEAIRVLIADGRALVRAGFRVLLEGEQGIAVADEAASGDEAVALARHTRPDVVLMDADLPGLDTLAATRQIVADPELQGVQVMILSSVENDEHLFEALRAGASGFLVNDTQPTELLRAVRVLARGEALLAPSVTRRVIAELASRPERKRPSPERLEELTAREREVMALVGEGMTNVEISEHLVVSPATARTHVSRAMIKLHARDRAQLVALAYQTGLVLAGGQPAGPDAQSPLLSGAGAG